MRLKQLFQQKKCPFSLEIFPPKQQSGIESVYAMLDAIAAIPADYISVTYSAGGGGARQYTGQIAQHLLDLGVEPLPHLTCVDARRSEISDQLAALRRAGIENILALRGDRVPGLSHARDFTFASDLIREIRRDGHFYVVAACYPEGHPESAGLEEDIEHLRLKQQAGAGHLVSQLFFDNGKFFRFLSRARKKGVDCPIEAGVMPIVRREQIERTIDLSSASLPPEFVDWTSRYADDEKAFYDAGIDYAVRQLRDLIENGVDGVHLYAMNKPDVVQKVYDGIRDLL